MWVPLCNFSIRAADSSVRIVAMDQYFEIISATDAWLIADDDGEEDSDSRTIDRELRPTNSARRVKALVEQVTGKRHLLSHGHDEVFTQMCRSLLPSPSVLSQNTLPYRCATPATRVLPCAHIFIT